MGKRVSLSKQKDLIWNKDSFSFSRWKLDPYDKWMDYFEYGNRQSKYGWEIEHTMDHALGGGDHHSNLRACNWKSNLERNRKDNPEHG